MDHSGVPNAQLVKENHELAVAYKGKCVAEQNSMNLAWELFMKPEYSDFRKALLHNDISNMKRFRQLVVNSVMATDIWDKDLRVMRDTRWSKAFHSDAAAVAIADGTASEDKCDDVNRKATIVLEHVIQASDFSHTMQHWHIYRKWNERFFHESIVAFRNGRAGDQHPANSWYQREIDFFDCTIIPLTKKLKECGVFGVSSDEYLNYAEKNRAEWVFRGHEIVSEMTKKYDDILIASSSTTCTKDLVGLTVATLPFPIEL